MLQPKKGKLTRTLTRKSTSRPMTEEEKMQARKKEFRYEMMRDVPETNARFESSSKPPVKRMSKKITSEPVLKLKTKKAKAVDNAPMPKNERAAQSFSASKPKMKTLKGKIQLALMKAKKG
jgi:hypothetical protein